jgi:putative component of membrane protein insertase Oxa1/YidC/SpoIIIJ protein YidD
MTPDQLAAKVATKNAKDVGGGILLLLLAAVLWPITFLASVVASAILWSCIAAAGQQPESNYGVAIFLTSLVIFGRFAFYGYFRINAVFNDGYFEKASLSGYGFSAVYFLGGITTRLAILWGAIMCAPIFTRMGIHQIRERLPNSPFTLDVAAKLFNEMDADQRWRPLPTNEPQRTAAMLLAKLELIRCSPDRRGGFDIRVPSKDKDFF